MASPKGQRYGRPVHESSFEKVRAFRNSYLRPDAAPFRVLDVGSACVNSGSLSYRDLFRPPDFEYVGLDLAPGLNVDLVPRDPYSWDEISSESVDVAVCGQAFEHSPFFWITAAEIARVLTPGGYAVVIAPSGGHVHRFPVDCWRFNPDSWRSICAYVGLDLLETMREDGALRMTIPGRYWGDAMMIARKPALEEDTARRGFYERLEAIVTTRTDLSSILPGPGRKKLPQGPATAAYRRTHVRSRRAMMRHPLRLVLSAASWSGNRLRRWGRPVSLHWELVEGARSRLRGETAMPWPPEGPATKQSS